MAWSWAPHFFFLETPKLAANPLDKSINLFWEALYP